MSVGKVWVSLFFGLFQIIFRMEILKTINMLYRKALPFLSVVTVLLYFFLVPLSGAIDRGRDLDIEYKNERLQSYSDRKGTKYADVKDPEFIEIITSGMDGRAIEAQNEFFNSTASPLLIFVSFIFLIFRMHVAVVMLLTLVFSLAAIRVSSSYSFLLLFSPVVFWFVGGVLRKVIEERTSRN